MRIPANISEEQYEFGVAVVTGFAKKLNTIIDYVAGLSDEQRKTCIDVANSGGIVSLIEKIIAGRKAQKRRKTVTLQSVMGEISKLNREGR